MIISSTIMFGVKVNSAQSKAEIEKKARNMGMEYKDEMRVLQKGNMED
ncbi:hypothetical protein ACER0A_007720 [Haloimpatiens sp. FM7315]